MGERKIIVCQNIFLQRKKWNGEIIVLEMI